MPAEAKTPAKATQPKTAQQKSAQATVRTVQPDSPPLTERQEARRRRILHASAQLASRGGFDAVQMRDVATRAEVALGTIYRYFPSKDSLLLAVMVHWLGDLEGGTRLCSSSP